MDAIGEHSHLTDGNITFTDIASRSLTGTSIQNAGVTIQYGKVHDDIIDGAILARSETDCQTILMPDNGDAFPDIETACRILGHEMGHIMTGLQSVDGNPVLREVNERTCDYIGALLYRLAEMTAGYEAERIFREYHKLQELGQK